MRSNSFIFMPRLLSLHSVLPPKIQREGAVEREREGGLRLQTIFPAIGTTYRRIIRAGRPWVAL